MKPITGHMIRRSFAHASPDTMVGSLTLRPGQIGVLGGRWIRHDGGSGWTRPDGPGNSVIIWLVNSGKIIPSIAAPLTISETPLTSTAPEQLGLFTL